MIKKLVLTTTCLFFVGCGVAQKPVAQNIQPSEPKWLLDPTMNQGGKLAAVGCSGMHVNGKSAQEKLAIQRAIDEIAMQKNTKVSNVTLRNKSFSSGGNTSSKGQTTSLHEVNNQNISTKVLDKYVKPNGDICVWVVER